MKFSIKKVLLVSAGILTVFAATGCSGIFGGNSHSDVKKASSSVREQFGSDFKLKSKNRLSVLCVISPSHAAKQATGRSASFNMIKSSLSVPTTYT